MSYRTPQPIPSPCPAPCWLSGRRKRPWTVRWNWSRRARNCEFLPPCLAHDCTRRPAEAFYADAPANTDGRQDRGRSPAGHSSRPTKPKRSTPRVPKSIRFLARVLPNDKNRQTNLHLSFFFFLFVFFFGVFFSFFFFFYSVRPGAILVPPPPPPPPLVRQTWADKNFTNVKYFFCASERFPSVNRRPAK